MPYKFSRLKKGYLFLIIVALFTISLYATKTVFNSIVNKEEKAEEKSVGDVNEIMDYPFEIRWDDKDYESNRPSSITYNLYNVLDENTVVSTVTLTPTNVDNEDSNKWNGTFTNIRKYNDDETPAEYIIKQQEISNYIQKYDVKDMNGLCIEFGSNIFNGDTNKHIKIAGSSDWRYYYYSSKNNSNQQIDYYYNDLNNNRICVPANVVYKDLYIISEETDISLDINKIYPVHKNLTLGTKRHWLNQYDHYDYYQNENYPEMIKTQINRYMYEEKFENFNGANIIENYYNVYNLFFDKYWEDEGNVDLRPNNSEFYLYRKDNQNNILKTITLTNANADSNDNAHWVGMFENIQRYDDEGHRIEYVVREKNIPNYVTSYDSNEGLSITFNENNDFSSPNVSSASVAYLFYYNEEDSKWYQYNTTYNMFGDDFAGRTLNIKFQNDSRFVEGNGISSFKSDSDNSAYFGIKEYVGTIYPEMYHNTAMMDYYLLHYNYSLSNHSQGFYFAYRGPSWSGTYGLKIDNITTIGDETIITSRINLRDLEITKKWEDNGYESNRPSSVTIDIIDANNSNNIIKTISLTSQDNIDNYTWKKTIKNLPKYDDNLQEIEYMISERKINDEYITIYDADDYYNGLAITFADNLKGIEEVQIGYQKAGNSFKIIAPRGGKFFTLHTSYINESNGSQEISNHMDNLSNRTIKTTTRDLYMIINLRQRAFLNLDYANGKFSGGEYKLKIDKIEPIHNEITPASSSSWTARKVKESSFDDYWDIDNNSDLVYDPVSNISGSNDYYYWHYIWKGSLKPMKNCYVIINKYNKRDYEINKEWVDSGHENERPNSVKFNLYNSLDENTIVATKILTSNNALNDNSNRWNGTIAGIPKYNSDGTEANYILKEEPVENYITTYDVSRKNGYCVELTDDFYNNKFDRYIYFLLEKDGLRKQISQKNNLDEKYFFYAQTSTPQTICFKTENNHFYMWFDNSLFKQIIANIYPVYREEYDYEFGNVKGSFSTMANYIRYDDYKLLNKISHYYAHYEWVGSKDYFEGSDLIKNTYALQDIEFKKRWEDEGYEDNRPTSVEYYLYNSLDDNNIISTISLTNNNQNETNDNEWDGVFKNVPIYNSDGSLARYIIKEEKLEKYTQKYDSFNKNGFCVVTTDEFAYINTSGYSYDKFLYFSVGDEPYLKSRISDRTILDLVSDFMNGANPKNLKEICFRTDTNDFYLYESRQVIENIYPMYQNEYDFVAGNVKEYFNPNSGINITKKDYLDLAGDNYFYLHYTWTGSDEPFIGDTLIINYANMREEGYVKEFDDTGYEYNRPKELVFGLYVEDDPVPKEMTTLHTSTCINNKCNIEFKNVKDKDSDGNPINYIIKEISDYGYIVTYLDDKVINTANPVDIKFIKENNEGRALRGAKFAIYNKSNDKIYEFTSSNKEISIKLLPSEYTIKEIEVPEGYERSNDIRLVVNEDGTYTQDGNAVETIKVVNEPIKEKYSINLKKTLKTNEEKEFEFEISIVDFGGTLEYTGDREGTLTFNDNKAIVRLGGNQSITIKDIPVNSRYEIRELSNDYLVTVVGDRNGTLNRNETVEFINVPREVPGNGDSVVPEEKDVPTPITGVFNIMSYIAGILLLILSAFLIIYSKKQTKRS